MLKFESERLWGPPSARRFVTLRASENNVVRKLEAHGSLAPAGSVCYGDSMRTT